MPVQIGFGPDNGHDVTVHEDYPDSRKNGTDSPFHLSTTYSICFIPIVFMTQTNVVRHDVTITNKVSLQRKKRTELHHLTGRVTHRLSSV